MIMPWLPWNLSDDYKKTKDDEIEPLNKAIWYLCFTTLSSYHFEVPVLSILIKSAYVQAFVKCHPESKSVRSVEHAGNTPSTEWWWSRNRRKSKPASFIVTIHIKLIIKNAQMTPMRRNCLNELTRPTTKYRNSYLNKISVASSLKKLGKI